MESEKDNVKIIVNGEVLFLNLKEYNLQRRYYDVLANELLPDFFKDPELSKEYQEILEKRKKLT